jgi:hypothetical protein
MVGNSEGKRPLENPTWEDNINMDFQEIVCELDWTGTGLWPTAGSCE